MNYPAMRYVASEDCTVKGPARAILWVIAYHADRDSGECWVGQRRLARESGLARSTVQRALDELFGDGVLEYVEDHRGPKPDRYQIAPDRVEGTASASGVVEGTARTSGMVEGQLVVGEVIHNPASSGLGASPLAGTAEWLVDRSGGASGPIRGPKRVLVDRSADSSGLLPRRSPAETASKGLEQGFEPQGGKQVLGDADSIAGAIGAAEAAEPLPVDPKVLDELERRGLRRRPRSDPARPEAPTRSREEQLAELERIIAADEG